ncbi:MAG: zinc-ribbon domain-containing protein [Desulfovibrionaceae bacterium]|nr:zinc-ribbon domain-containing protein [Desulfovibrionaceae bacterium]
MIIVCPKCSTKFNLPDDKVSPLRKVKCSFCGNIFVMADGLDDKAFSQLPGLGASAPSADEKPRPVVAAEPEAPRKAAAPQKKRSKLLPIMLGLLVLLLGGAGAGLYFSGIIGGGSDDGQTQTEPVPQSELNATGQAPAPQAEDGEIKDIIFQNTKQYFVNNEKLGQIFVVEGKTVNNYRTPKELIRIEASLLDAHGAVVASKQLFCGVTLTMFQLQVLSEEEIEKALNNNIEILANNLNIQPGGSVSFMTVFVNPPQSISTLFLKVVDAKDSPN